MEQRGHSGGIYQATSLVDDSVTTSKVLNEAVTLPKMAGYSDIGKNLFYKPTTTHGYHISNVGVLTAGKYSTTDIDCTSDFIPVNIALPYICSEYALRRYYDIAKVFLGYNNGSAAMSFPANTTYVRVCMKTVDIDTFMVEQSATATTFEECKYSVYGLRIPDVDTSILGVQAYILEIDNVRDLSFSRFISSITFDDVYRYLLTENGLPVVKLDRNGSLSTKFYTVNIPVSYGECIEVDMFAKYDDATNLATGIRCSYLESDNTTVHNLIGYDIRSVDYKDYKFKFVVPYGCEMVEIAITLGTDVSLYIRNFAISRHNNPQIPLSGVRFIAHKGMSYLAPENTMSAFQLAKRAGFWGCVLNCNDTADGQIVCIHNETIDDTSDGTGNVYDLTLAELRAYDYGSWFDAVYTGEKIPLLNDALAFCSQSGMHPYIRLSHRFTDDTGGFLTDIYNLIKDNGLLNHCTIIGFERAGLEAFSAIAGNTVRYGYCMETDLTQGKIDWVKALGNDVFLDIRDDASRAMPDADLVLAKANNIPVENWTTVTFAKMYTAVAKGVTGFTTDWICLDGCMY